MVGDLPEDRLRRTQPAADEESGPERGKESQRSEDRRQPPSFCGDRRRNLRRCARSARCRLEREREVVRRVEAFLRPFLEAVAKDALDRGRERSARLGESSRVPLGDRRHRLRRRLAAERTVTREHLVQDRAERKDVRAVVRRPAAHLLGRHVADGAHHRAWFGGRDRRRSRLVRLRR